MTTDTRGLKDYVCMRAFPYFNIVEQYIILNDETISPNNFLKIFSLNPVFRKVCNIL